MKISIDIGMGMEELLLPAISKPGRLGRKSLPAKKHIKIKSSTILFVYIYIYISDESIEDEYRV